MSDVEFTEYDEHMLSVMDYLEKLQARLAGHALWFSDEWSEVSEEPMPFFEVHEKELGDGRSLCQFVFVLTEHTVQTDDLNGHREK